MHLISGQKIALNQIIQTSDVFTLRIQMNATFEIDVSSFGLGVGDTLFNDDYMTFYNQPQTPAAEVRYQQQRNAHLFHFNLKHINHAQTPRFIQCAAVSDQQKNLRDVKAIQIELLNSSGQVVATYALSPSY